MMLCQNGLEIVREGRCLLFVAIGNVSDQVDNVVEGHNRVSGRRGGRHEKDLALSLILFPLLQKLFLV